MGYDADFYEAYERYLSEPSVREAHDWAVNSFSLSLPVSLSVVDFGCGQSREFQQYYSPSRYIGVDENVDKETNGFLTKLIKTNYRTMDFSNLVKSEVELFVSLFSSENTSRQLDNYRFYKKLFKEIPSLNFGMVSGFYYKHKKHRSIVEEAGGILSYQTLESLDSVQNLVFNEKRIVMHVPSHMFGDDVYEVWKLFTRI